MITIKMLGMLVVAFVAGSFVASPELRAYAANTVFSTDIVDGQVKTADLAGNAVTAPKIKDGEIKAAEIATDAVGAAEIQGVNKLLFGKCAFTSTEATQDIPAGDSLTKICSINGVVNGDHALATVTVSDNSKNRNECFAVTDTNAHGGAVDVHLVNVCDSTTELGPGNAIAVLVYNK
ncbi:MAG TPA: hypothetical protein VGQ03_05955 [Nitrososphaera sp.]|jgi:hypothetical protein|nr:hypothetical protein [Nitrososphaera sp.]